MDYTETEIQAARLQTEAKMNLLRRRAKYYQNEREMDNIREEDIFQQILKMNRRLSVPDGFSLKPKTKLGDTQKKTSILQMEKELKEREVAEFKEFAANRAIQQENMRRRGLLKQAISLNLHEIETKLSISVSNRDQSLEIYLEELVQMVVAYITTIQSSDIEKTDKMEYIQRLRNLDISILENWMHSLNYHILKDAETIQRIRALIEQFGEYTGIPLEFQINMDTEDDEAYCRQLLEDDMSESRHAWIQNHVFSFDSFSSESILP
jgi:hypothetical protein